MGDLEIDNDAVSLHKVRLSKDFWLGKTEVTQDQWSKIMGTDEIHPEKPSPFRGVNPNFPVTGVSYFDIEIFLEKLNELSDGYTFRLPTEAEWEYACRAGTKTPFSYGSYLQRDSRDIVVYNIALKVTASLLTCVSTSFHLYSFF